METNLELFHLECCRLRRTNNKRVPFFYRHCGEPTILCYFCGEEITKFRGRDPDSLALHSLDGDHDNWAPENKIFCHYGCHNRYHATGGKFERKYDPILDAFIEGSNNLVKVTVEGKKGKYLRTQLKKRIIARGLEETVEVGCRRSIVYLSKL